MLVPLLHYPPSHPWNVYYALFQVLWLQCLIVILHTVHICSPCQNHKSREERAAFLTTIGTHDGSFKPKTHKVYGGGKKKKRCKECKEDTDKQEPSAAWAVNSNNKRLTSALAEVMHSGHDSNGLVVRIKLSEKPCLFNKLHNANSP